MNTIIHQIFLLNHNNINIPKIPTMIITDSTIPESTLKAHLSPPYYYSTPDPEIQDAIIQINIWQHITENNIINALIIKKNTHPVTNIDHHLMKHWFDIPLDYDIIVLSTDTIHKVPLKSNSFVHQYEPPENLNAYIISNKAAKFLTKYFQNNKIIQKIDNQIQYLDLKIYTFDPPLFINNIIFPKIQHHFYINKIFYNNKYLTKELFYFRPLDFSFSNFLLILCMISLMVSFFGYNIGTIYLNLIILLYSVEFLLSKNYNYHIMKILLFEILLIILCVIPGSF
jgi:hypothetical protein